MLFGENAIRRPADRSSQNHASLTRYVYHRLFATGRLTRPAPTQAPVGAFLRAEGYSKRCCQFEVCRRAAASVGDVLKGVPLRAEGFPKRRCQFESVAAERRI